MFEYDELDAIEFLQTKGLPYLKTGSRVICDPPVMDTDIDIVVCDTGGRFGFKYVKFEDFGFTCTNDSGGYNGTGFDTYRQGEVNLIVVDSMSKFKSWRIATEAAKSMNLRNKDDRIKLFQGVLYENW